MRIISTKNSREDYISCLQEDGKMLKKKQNKKGQLKTLPFTSI